MELDKRHTQFDPFFREKIFERMVGSYLQDILVLLDKDYTGVFLSDKTIDEIVSLSYVIVLCMSNGMYVRFKSRTIYISEINEVIFLDGKAIQRERDYLELISTNRHERIYVSLFEIFEEKSKKFASKDNILIDYCLWKESPLFKERVNRRLWNELWVRGFGLIFSEGVLNLTLGEDPFSPPYKLEFNSEKMEFKTASKEFCPKGKLFMPQFNNYIYVPVVEIENDKVIHRNSKNITHFIHSGVFASGAVEVIFRKYDKEKIISLSADLRKNHISFLEELKTDFKQRQYGIPDVTLAICNDGSLKIVEPYDVTCYFDENDKFLDKILRFYQDD